MAEQVAGSDTAALRERLSEASNILVLSSSFATRATDACMDLLTDGDTESAAIIAITYTQAPGDWVTQWCDHADTSPANGIVIGVGNPTPVDFPDLPPAVRENWQSKTIDATSDLTGLGIKISESLTETREDETIDSVQLCFDSLTALLQYGDCKRVFQFLHIVTGRVRSANAVGHYHLNPAAHDDQTLATIEGLFDAVIEINDDGPLTVRTR